MRQASWAATLSSSLAARALDVACEVARRLQDRRHVELAFTAAPTQSAFPKTAHWRPIALAQGDAGLALTCAHLDACFPGEEWDRTGHIYLAAAAEGAERFGYIAPGMFGGLAGLAFAAWLASRCGRRYRRLLDTVDRALLPAVIAQADALTRLNTGVRLSTEGVSFGEFDVISGLSGIGSYLLLRCENPGILAALESVLEALIAIFGGRRR
jgi:lantibiotic biosynthesis protein